MLDSACPARPVSSSIRNAHRSTCGRSTRVVKAPDTSAFIAASPPNPTPISITCDKASKIVAGYGFGVLGNIVVGIVGAVVAGFILPRVGFSMGGGTLAAIIHSTIGAVILLVLIRLVKRA